MAVSSRIARNTTYLSVASILQKVISFGYFAYLSRELGQAAIGKYGFALAFTSVFIIFMDFGLGPLLTREGSKSPEDLQQLVNRLFSIKIFLMVISLIALYISVFAADGLFNNVDALDVQLIALGSAVIIIDTLTFTLFSIFRATKDIHWEAIGIILYQLTILVCGVAAVQADLSLHFIIGALLAGSIIQLLYLGGVLLWKTAIRFRFTWNWEDAKRTLRLAAPFAIAGILFRLNGTVDNLMIKIIDGDIASGTYLIAFKLTFALTVLPGAFATSYYPVVSDYFKRAPEKLASTFEQGAFYMMLISAPIVAGVAVIGDNLIYQVWGEVWQGAVLPLTIFMIGLPFIFFNYPIGNFLNAVDKQDINTTNMFIALLVNVAMNALLIPRFSAVGAATAAVVSAVTLVALGLPWVYKESCFSIRYILTKLVLVAIPALIMGYMLSFIEDRVSLLLLIGLGGIIYAAGIIIFRTVNTQEWKQLSAAIRRR